MANVYGGGLPTYPPSKTGAMTQVPTNIYEQAAALRQPVDPETGYNPMNKQPTPVARSWSPQYQLPQPKLLSTNPYDPTGGAWKQGLAGSNVQQIGAIDYDLPTSGPALISTETGLDLEADYGFDQWVEAMRDQAYYSEEDRLRAAREQQVARGMGRSGEAILAEDDVRRQTELTIQQQMAEAAVQQAALEQDTMKAHADLLFQRESSNQRAQEQWAALVENAKQFQATLDFERQAANQQAAISQSGQALEYAGVLAELETRRALANQEASYLYDKLGVDYQMFNQELDLNSRIQQAQLDLGYSQVGATNMGNMLDYQAALKQIQAQYGGGSGGLNMEDVGNSLYAMSSDNLVSPEYMRNMLGLMYGDEALKNPYLAQLLQAQGASGGMTAQQAASAGSAYYGQ